MNRSHAFAIIAALILLVLTYLLVFDASKVFNQQDDVPKNQHNAFYSHMGKVDHTADSRVDVKQDDSVKTDYVSGDFEESEEESEEKSLPTTPTPRISFTTENPQTTVSKTTSETPQTTTASQVTHFSTNPGINFINLKDRKDLGIEYYPRANVMSDQNRYAIIVAHEMIAKGSVQYTFNIPVTCMAWMQIGYGCFIVMPYFQHHAVGFLKKAKYFTNFIP